MDNEQKEYWYSTNEEIFPYGDFEEAVDMAWNESFPPAQGDDKACIWRGEAVPRVPSDYAQSADRFIEDMQERACEACGEIADGWPHASNDQIAALDEMLTTTVNKWAEESKLVPTFFGIENVEEITVEFGAAPEGSDDQYTYKIVSPHPLTGKA